jgi:hypothetical protein
MLKRSKSRPPLKAPQLRVPGQSLEATIHRIEDGVTALWILLPLLLWAIAALDWWAKANDVGRQPWVFVATALIMTVVGARRIYLTRVRVKALKLGLAGERAVGQFLEGLRVGGARILHDIQGDRFNIDHVVVSSRGIYCIETKTITKHRPDAVIHFDGRTVLINGRAPDRDPIKQVTAAAKWLSTQIAESTGKRFWVRPVVVYPSWFIETPQDARRAAVWVLEPKALVKWIENESANIDDSDVSLVSYHLSRIAMAGDNEGFDI